MAGTADRHLEPGGAVRCGWWALVPPGVNGTRFPLGHFVLRAAAAAPVWWWFARRAEHGHGGAVVLFVSACAMWFSLMTLWAAAQAADMMGRECD